MPTRRKQKHAWGLSRKKIASPVRYPKKNSALTLSAAYNIGDIPQPRRIAVPKSRERAKLPGIGSRDSTTADYASATEAWARKSQTNTEAKKKKKRPKKNKTLPSQEPGVVRKTIQKVNGSRYISVHGSLKLGDRDVRIIIQDATSRARYKTSFQLDEESARTAQADEEQAASLLRVVAMACTLVPNRDASGLISKKKPWRASIDTDQLQDVLKAQHEMDEEERQQEKPARSAPVRHTQHRDTEGEFDYFDETLSCPRRKKKRRRRRKRLKRPPVPSAKNFAMRAPRFLPRADDITFQCTRVLDSREMHMLAAYRPLDGSITLQARDAAIHHCWRLSLSSRAPGAGLAEDGGFVNLPAEQQMVWLEELLANLRIADPSAHSLGTLELSTFTDAE